MKPTTIAQMIRQQIPMPPVTLLSAGIFVVVIHTWFPQAAVFDLFHTWRLTVNPDSSLVQLGGGVAVGVFLSILLTKIIMSRKPGYVPEEQHYSFRGNFSVGIREETTFHWILLYAVTTTVYIFQRLIERYAGLALPTDLIDPIPGIRNGREVAFLLGVVANEVFFGSMHTYAPWMTTRKEKRDTWLVTTRAGFILVFWNFTLGFGWAVILHTFWGVFNSLTDWLVLGKDLSRRE